jgi:hypothetical protein
VQNIAAFSNDLNRDIKMAAAVHLSNKYDALRISSTGGESAPSTDNWGGGGIIESQAVF